MSQDVFKISYFFYRHSPLKVFLREAAKKKKIPPLVAGPLRGGEGGKGRATKEKRTFF